jgi:hypothetical protein
MARSSVLLALVFQLLGYKTDKVRGGLVIDSTQLKLRVINCRKQDLIFCVIQAMNRLRVKCIKCGKEWEKGSAIPWGDDDYSSSLCRLCFIEVASPTIHRKQLHEGNFDCFGKGGAYCDQLQCKYRQWCLHIEKEDSPPCGLGQGQSSEIDVPISSSA